MVLQTQTVRCNRHGTAALRDTARTRAPLLRQVEDLAAQRQVARHALEVVGAVELAGPVLELPVPVAALQRESINAAAVPSATGSPDPSSGGLPQARGGIPAQPPAALPAGQCLRRCAPVKALALRSRSNMACVISASLASWNCVLAEAHSARSYLASGRGAERKRGECMVAVHGAA